MRIWGWILLIFGIMSTMGALLAGHTLGGMVWAVLGLYLLHRANQRDKEKEDKDKWKNNS